MCTVTLLVVCLFRPLYYYDMTLYICCRQTRAEAAAQKISDYQAREKAKMAVSELLHV